jgi:hypothetical protein
MVCSGREHHFRVYVPGFCPTLAARDDHSARTDVIPTAFWPMPPSDVIQRWHHIHGITSCAGRLAGSSLSAAGEGPHVDAGHPFL